MSQTDLEDAQADPQATFSGTREVDPRYALNKHALDAWLEANVPAYSGPLDIRQFKGGQSNPTYELTTPGRTSRRWGFRASSRRWSATRA